MRRILLLAFSVSLNGQTFPNPLQQPEIVEYFGLTSQQLDAIRKAAADPSDLKLLDRRDELKVEIFAETGVSPLQPARLGRLYAELEVSRRQLEANEAARNVATRKILNPEQLVKLKTLEEVSRLRNAAISAGMYDLLPIDCGTRDLLYIPQKCESPYFPLIGSIPDWGPRPDDDRAGDGPLSHYSRLLRYLNLSEAQQQQMEENRKEVYRDGSEITRMVTVAREIGEETKRPVLDEYGLGIRYAELETRRRIESDTQRRLERLNQAVLTPAQRVKFGALEEAVRLRPTVKEARAANMMGTRCKDQVYLLLDSPQPFGFQLFPAYLGDCPDRRALEELP